MKKNALIIVAHRDDETFGCGATIAKLSDNNFNIYAISMTDGVSSRHGSNSIKIKSRFINSVTASKILKFKWLDDFTGEFKDNSMGLENLLEVIKLIEKAKKKVNPEIVFTHFSDDLNIDHQIVANATMTAFRPKANDNCKMILSFEIPSSTDYASYKKKIFRPNYYVNIDNYWRQKLKAMKAYKTELMKYPNSRSLKGLQNLAKFRGNQVGLKMAESFQILRFLEK